MTTLWRVNPRAGDGSFTALLTQRRPTAAGGLVGIDRVFGLVGTVATAQASQTSAISGSISTPTSATIITGQGSQTTDVAATIKSTATIATGQGAQTSSLVGTLAFIATIETGQGTQTTDSSGIVTSPQLIMPLGWWDAGNELVNPGASFWQLNPRAGLYSLPSVVTARFSTGASVANSAMFSVVPWTYYSDGTGSAIVTNGTQTAVPSGIASGAFGSPNVYNLRQYIASNSISSTVAFGTPALENKNKEVFPTSINSALAFGTAGIINRNRYVQPTGRGSSLTVGQQFVWNWNREVSLPSLGVMVGFGTASLVNLKRFVYPQRIDPKSVGTHAIELWIRYLRPSGTNMALYGTPVVIGPRYLRPTWKTEKWLHEHKVDYFDRSIYPNGFGLVYTNVGFFSDIRNRNRYILPDGIEEPERFGPIVYNPPTDIIWVDGDINTSFVTDEADIYNSARNKIILRAAVNNGTTFGTARMSPMYLNMSGKSKDMIAWGKPRVENYIRYVEQKQSGNFGRFGTAWVSFYVREVAPYGIDESCVFYEYPAPDPTTGKLPGVYPQAVTIYPDSFEGSGVTYDNCGFPRTPQIPRPSVHP